MLALLLAFVALGPVGRTAFAHDNEIWREYSYLGGMDAIALGCLTAMALPYFSPTRTILRAVGAAGLLTIGIIIFESRLIQASFLGRYGLDMSLLAIGTCLALCASTALRSRLPRALLPLQILGRHSYVIYLTHMFVVFALFHGYMTIGAPPRRAAFLFAGVIVLAGSVGTIVARCFTDPLNRRLRRGVENDVSLDSNNSA